MDNIFNFLQDGDKNIVLDNHKEVVLLLGNTGSGKSTLAQYIAGDNEKLIAKETVEGSGEFIIYDGHRISNSTVNSKTLYPELVVDAATDTAFYDCPGFSDTRSAEFDIAATYFVKRVIDHADSVKLVFVVSNPSVQTGVDRHDFMTLVRHITTLVKDIDKFGDGIALIVTKVNNDYKKTGKTFTLVSDKIVIMKIASYLIELMASLQEKLSKTTIEHEKVFYNKAITLISFLLVQQDDKYVRLGIFRRPDESGPLSNIPMLQEGKKSLVQMIHNDISFVPKNQNDFGYTVSESSKNVIFSMVDLINQDIAFYTEHTGQEILSYYYTRIENSKNIQELQQELEEGYSAWSDFISQVGESEKPEAFVMKIVSVINNFKFNIIDNGLINILNKGLYLDFLQSVSNKELKTRSLDWLNPFQSATATINELKSWNQFSIDLYHKLSEYDIQRDTTKYNVANLSEWGLREKQQGIYVNKENIHQFLNIATTLNINTNNLNTNVFDSSRILDDINNVLFLTLRSRAVSSCPEPGMLLVKGDFIKLSDISSSMCGGNVKAVEILALNTVFVDEDLIRETDNMQVAIIAPKWHVIGNRKISLNGSPGAAHNVERAEDGVYVGQGLQSTGKPGKPGLPGGNGGNFVGIGLEFVNEEYLTIISNGGPGGPGQNGGNGATGYKGVDATVPDADDDDDRLSTVKLPYRTIGDEETHRNRWKGLKWIRQRYLFDGAPGGAGTNGNAGGVGGVGGHSGIVNLIPLNKVPKVKTSVNNGAIGRGGKGGSGGEGGVSGCNKYALREKKKKINSDDRVDWKDQSLECLNIKAASGANGPDSQNGIGRGQPGEIQGHETALTVNKYKGYLRENLKNRFKNKPLSVFIQELDLNLAVTGLYDTLGFLGELQGLEAQFYKIGGEDLLIFYERLLQKISNYAKNPKAKENTPQYKKVLNYLYTATFSKISSLKAASETNLIIDINEFLDLSVSNIGKLHGKSKIDLVNTSKNTYKGKIDMKISEAVNFIEKEITPQIGHINVQLDGEIDSLLDETAELQRTLLLRKMFGIVQGIGEAVSMLGPVGATISTVDAGKSVVAQSLLLDNKVTQEKEFRLPAGIKHVLKSTRNRLKSFRNKRINTFENRLDELYTKLFEYPEELGNAKVKITETKTKLAELRTDDGLNLDRVQLLEDEFHKELKTNSAELQKEKYNDDPRAQTASKLIDYFIKETGVVNISIDVYSSNKNKGNKMANMSAAIRKAQAQIDALEEYEKRIYNTLIPLIREMQNAINDLENKLKTKSEVALIVSQWQIQTIIKDMKLEMQQFTKGFDVQENLARCVEKLGEVMSTIINVYDRIQSYQDQEILADYIADISSPAADSIIVTDSKLASALNSLELMIQSNIVLGQYERAVNGFKQWVFPFAHFYLEEYRLPAQLNLENNIQNLVSTAVTKITNLKSKVQEYNSSIQKYDEHILKGDFNSFYKSNLPFYVWKNEVYHDMIAKLLSGEEIIVKADVRDSLPNRNAVKFNLLELHLRPRTEEQQMELDSKLRNFRVEMTHMGNSYYRCIDKFYVITSESQTIRYTFEKGENGQPINTNIVYNKIRDGDLMLSPYAMWGFKLVNVTDVSFSELEKYNTEVDLELVGRGQYVSDDVTVCNSTLDHYYKVEDTIHTHEQEELQDVLTDIVKNGVNYAMEADNATHHVKRRSLPKEEYEFISNAASSAGSPINDAINWMRKRSGMLMSTVLSPIQQINDWITGGSVKPDMLSSAYQQYSHSSFDGGLTSWSGFNSNGALILADVLIRKITKAKPCCSVEQDVSHSEAQAFVLNTMVQFEELLEAQLEMKNTSISEIDLDPVALQKKLLIAVLHGDRLKAVELLYDAAKDVTHSWRQTEIENLKDNISRIIHGQDNTLSLTASQMLSNTRNVEAMYNGGSSSLNSNYLTQNTFYLS